MTAKHYAYLGGYVGFFAFLGQATKHWDDAAGAVKQGEAIGLLALLLAFCAFGSCIGWCIGRAQAYSEKRRRARNESLIIRR